MTFVVLKTVTVWACPYAKISVKKPSPTLGLVLALASSPRVHDKAVALHSGLWHQEAAAGSVYMCVMGNHLPHPRIALLHSSMHK